MQSQQSTASQVSVVMAIYNGEKFLREQLDSIFNQTYPILEVIAVDDCSTDSSVKILKEYAATHSNMKIYLNERNDGYIKTFEKGISLSEGNYVSLCDQDDWWESSKIEETMKAFDERVMISYCDSLFVDENGKSLERKISDVKNLTDYDSPLPFLIGNTVAGHAAIFKRVLLKNASPFPENIIHDWWLAYVATLHGSIRFVNKPLVKYRQHNSNVIGAIKVKGRKRESRLNKNKEVRRRIQLFFEKCPNSNIQVKNVLLSLQKSYASFSLKNNFRRMITFFKFRDALLATKKRSDFRKQLFCFKMFFKII